MATELLERPLTEAQRIVSRLESEFGMTAAEIAGQSKIKAQTIHDIKRRTNTGNLQLRFLRPLIRAMESTGNPLDSIGQIDPIFSNPDLSRASNAEEPASITLNGEDPTPAPAKTLKDKAGDILGSILSGTVGDTTPKRTKADDDEQAGLVAQLVPLAALLIVSAGTFALHDPYKPCAPNMQEASAIAYPIIKRAVRELDARKKLSEGTQDAIIILLAVTAYGQRALGTYRQIHAMEVERDRSNGQTSANGAGANIAGFTAAPAAADPARSAVHHGGAPVAFPARAGGGRGQSDGGPRGAGGSADERRANDAISALLAADTVGRRQLGLG